MKDDLTLTEIRADYLAKLKDARAFVAMMKAHPEAYGPAAVDAAEQMIARVEGMIRRVERLAGIR